MKKRKDAVLVKELIPPDLKQCQAEYREPHGFMRLGPPPPMERCKNKPTHIATEPPREDGEPQGSMSLCDECLAVFQEQVKGCTIVPIPEKRPYRLVVCLDVEAESLKDAYGRVYEAMGKLPEGFDWESSDEAFDPEGELIDVNDLGRARMEYIDEHAICRSTHGNQSDVPE